MTQLANLSHIRTILNRFGFRLGCKQVNLFNVFDYMGQVRILTFWPI